MLQNRTFRILLVLALVFANVGCDQISKKMARTSIPQGQPPIPIIDDYFVLMNVENEGAFLSLGHDFSPLLKNILLLGLPILMLVGALLYLFFQKDLSKIALIGWSFFIGGGIGNMFDRIKYGSVTDFLFIDLGGIFRTGVFNMADVSIMVGMGFLILFYIQDSRKSMKEKAPTE
ncbi:MAG: signal peptidase II [Bacteroidota bacterium]